MVWAIVFLFGLVNLLYPLRKLLVTSRWTGGAIMVLAFYGMGIEGMWEVSKSPPLLKVLEVVGITGLMVALFGLVNVVVPLRAYRVNSRKAAGLISAAGLGGFALAALVSASIIGDVQGPTGTAIAEGQAHSSVALGTSSTPASSADANPADAPAAAREVPAAISASPSPGTAPPAKDVVPTPPIPTKPMGRSVAMIVTRVIDGDTFQARFSVLDRVVTIRMLGIDTPETVHPTKGVQPYGVEASQFTSSRLKPGQRILLETDVQTEDQYKRLLAYVWIGEELFNATLIKNGYAQVLTIPPNVKYATLFRALQQEAHESRVGLWSLTDSPAEPDLDSGPPPTAERKRGSFHPDANGNCLQDGVSYYKGNANSGIYHGPTGQFYDRTRAEICFYTREDAQAAGYRGSMR